MTKPWLRSLICFSRAGKACTVSQCCVLHRVNLCCALYCTALHCITVLCFAQSQTVHIASTFLSTWLLVQSISAITGSLVNPSSWPRWNLPLLLSLLFLFCHFYFHCFWPRWKRGELLFCLWSDTQQSSCPLIRWGRFWGECKIVWQIQINKFKNKTNYRKSITKSIT